MAEKQRLTNKSPARNVQHNYFESYIKPQRERTRLKRNSHAMNNTDEKKFIPLRDLLRKNHADRVQDHLRKEEEKERDEKQQ